jgi:hypothetical protein
MNMENFIWTPSNKIGFALTLQSLRGTAKISNFRRGIRLESLKVIYLNFIYLASPNKIAYETQITFKPHISEKSERLGDSSLKNKLKDFKGSHADFLISEALRIKVERDKLAKQKEEESVKAL